MGQKGLLKKYCDTVDLGSDIYGVNKTIIDALLNDGYEVIVRPVFDERHQLIGEVINIYKISESA